MQAARALSTVVVLCGLASPALAEWSSEEPPAHFVEASYALTVFVQFKPQREVEAICSRPAHELENGPLPVGWVLYGCSTADSFDELCIITISLNLPANVSPEHVERHERAHCAGWRH